MNIMRNMKKSNMPTSVPRAILVVVAVLILGCSLRGQQATHLLDVIPNSSGSTVGEIRFIETTGWGGGSAVQGISLKASASMASDFDWIFPNANPGATNCLEVTTGGQIQYAAGACGTAGGAPFVDTTSIVEGSADGTKEIRFEVDGLTTGTIRVLTPQDADYILAGTNITNSFSVGQNFTSIAMTSILEISGSGLDYFIDRSSGEGLIFGRTGGDDIIEIEEISTVLNEVRFQSGSGASDDVQIALVSNTGGDGFNIINDRSENQLVIERQVSDNEIVIIEEESSSLNGFWLLTDTTSTDDVRLRFLNAAASNGYNLRYDQDPSDRMVWELHSGTEIIQFDATLFQALGTIVIRANGGFNDNGNAGIDLTCAGGDSIINAQVSGGIIVAGSCGP